MTAAGGSPTVLIVDDDEEIRDVLRMVFELDGFEVWEAANGLDAVTLTMQIGPDFVVLDYQMPVQDGEKTAKVLRSVAPDTRIVAFSGIITSKPYWADAFLTKEKLAELSPMISSLAVPA